MTEDEMVGWHHRFNGHEFEYTPEVGNGQGGLPCFSLCGHKELDMTGRLGLNNNNNNSSINELAFRLLKTLSPLSTHSLKFSSVQLLSRVRLFATPRITSCQASLSITNSRSSLKLMSIELVMPSSHLILCRPLLLLPPIPPSIRVFSNESVLRSR